MQIIAAHARRLDAACAEIPAKGGKYSKRQYKFLEIKD